jgi:hypothetical protein
VTFSTAGSTFDTLLAAYTGSSLGALTVVASSDDAGGAATSSVTFAAASGTTYRVAVDGYSGASGDVVLTWTVGGADTTPPSVSLTAPASGARVRATVSLGATATDDRAVVRVEFLVNGAVVGRDATAPYTSSWSSAAHYYETTVTVAARAVDASGNEATTAGQSITVDNRPPTVTLTSYPFSSSSTSASFSFTADETGAIFECQLDGKGFTSCTSPKSYSSLAVGSHSFAVRATDAIGNVGYIAWHNWAVLGAPANDAFAAGSALSGGSGSVSGENGGATKEAGEPAHAGNAGGRSVWFKWTAPAGGTVTFDTLGSSFDTLLAVYTGSSVGALTLVVSDDNGGGSGAASKLAFAAVAGTTYRIAVDGFNAAGGAYVLTFGQLGSSAAVETAIDSGPSGTTSSTSATFTFSSPTTGATFECRLDGAPWSACASPKTYSSLASGTHTFEVRAEDGAGAVDATPAARSWTVGSGAPANNAFAAATPLADASGSTGGSTAGASKEPGEPAHAGNAGGRSVWYVWTAPANANVTVHTGGSEIDTLLAVYTGTAVDSLALVAENDDAADGTSSVAFAATAGTAYRIAVDGFAGEQGTFSLAWALAADATPPVVRLTAPAAGAVVRGAVALSAEASDEVSVARVEFAVEGVVVGSDTSRPYGLSWDSTAVADGSVTVAARAYDEAGNRGDAEAVVVVDNRPDAPPVAGNLVGNWSFEDSTAGWEAWEGSLALVAGGAHGVKAVRVSSSGASPTIYPAPSQVGSATAGVVYTGGGQVRATAPRERVCLRIREFAAAGGVIGQAASCLLPASGWQPFPSLEYTALESGSRIELYAELKPAQAGDSFDLDALALTATAPAPPAPDGNLVSNWSFEDSTAGWLAWQGTLALVSGGAHAAKAVRVTSDGAAPTIYPSTSQVTNATAGTIYTAGAQLRALAPREQVCLRIREFAAAGGVIGQAASCLTPTAGWQPFPSLEYTAFQSGSRIELYAELKPAQTGDSYDLDALTLTATPAPAPPPGGNLITNWSFEDTTAGWLAWQATLALVAGGAHGAQAVRVSSDGGSPTIYPGSSHVANAVAGTTYSGGGQVRATTPRAQVCLRIREFAATGGVIGSTGSCLLPTTSWQPFPNIDYTALQSGSRIELYAELKPAQTGDSYDLDALTLTASP